MTSVDVDAVASADFPLVRKGFEPDAVRAFRDRVADYLRRGHAEAEAARLEAERLRRELQDARAELASEPHTDEAIAILGDDATRIIHAAQQSSKEIVAAAEAAAEEIRAKAREEAGRIADESRRESEDFGGRLSGQADEVRSRLRDEIRKARVEFAEEADRLRADARYEAEAIVEQAREDARALRADAEEAASERQGQGVILAAERIAAAEATAEARLAEATARARAVTSEAEASRDAVLGELQAHRDVLEQHVRALREAQTRARADIGAAQTMLSALTTELDHIRLRDVDVPPLDLDIHIPATLPADEGVEGPQIAEALDPSEADEEAMQEAPAAGGETSAEASADEGAEASADEGAEASADEEAKPEEPAVEGEVAAEPFDDVVEPSDDEIDALFERVVAHRGGAEVAVADPEPAIHAIKDGVDDDADWGFADDAAGDADGVVVAGPGAEALTAAATTPDDAEPTETRRRVLAALHQLAVDTGEIPLAEVADDGHRSGNGDGAQAAVDEDAADVAPGDVPEVEDDSDALDLVPALTRKVKRALQEVENAALDSDPDGAGVDVIAVFAEYLVPSAVDAMALGSGATSDVDLTDDAEVVVRVVCGTWAGELGAGLTGADAAAVATVVRDARGGAEAIAADLARTAFRAGRDRAARSPR